MDAEASREVAAPLCVELEGVLVANLFSEMVLAFIKAKPGNVFSLLLWLFHGAGRVKRELDTRTPLDVSLLPYRREVLDFLISQKQSGRELVLIAGEFSRIANAVACHLQCFSKLVACRSGEIGSGNSEVVSEVSGELAAFDYFGTARSKSLLWKSCRYAYIVAGRHYRGGEVAHRRSVQRLFEGRRGTARGLLGAVRPHQWVKNILLFVPLVLAHQVSNLRAARAAILAFVTMTLCAGGIYILNDLLDLETDRRHSTKTLRPLASGRLSILTGVVASAGLILLGFALTTPLPRLFTLLLLIYVVLTTAYSSWLKRKVLVDVIILSGLYSLRVIAGAVAVEVPLTMWLLVFSMFLFLSLAFAKRYAELRQVRDLGAEKIAGRGYRIADLRILEVVGPASGYLSVLVFCNYLSSSVVQRLYAWPEFLWLIAPVLLYWITRVWLLARRGLMHEDPIVFAVRDRISWITGGLILMIIVIAWAAKPHGLFVVVDHGV